MLGGARRKKMIERAWEKNPAEGYTKRILRKSLAKLAADW